jgi:hypothetical protein
MCGGEGGRSMRRDSCETEEKGGGGAIGHRCISPPSPPVPRFPSAFPQPAAQERYCRVDVVCFYFEISGALYVAKLKSYSLQKNCSGRW